MKVRHAGPRLAGIVDGQLPPHMTATAAMLVLSIRAELRARLQSAADASAGCCEHVSRIVEVIEDFCAVHPPTVQPQGEAS